MEDAKLNLELKYAWEWFQYHAGQRLTAFNFFLVLMGAVLVGYTQAVTHKSQALGIPLGFLGSFVASAFWAMDVRNEELVNCGRAALHALESQMAVVIRQDDESRRWLEEALPGRIQGHIYQWVSPACEMGKSPRSPDGGRLRWFSHRRWLRAVIVTMGVLSAIAGAWAALGFP